MTAEIEKWKCRLYRSHRKFRSWEMQIIDSKIQMYF